MTEPKKNNQAVNFAKYSGMAFQLFAITGVGTYIGYYIDKKLQNQTPYFAAGGSVLFLCFGLYLVLKELLKK
jgi:F0F1-type ATP synthase assembly protein I